MALDQVRHLIQSTDWSGFDQLLWFPSIDCGWYPVSDEETYGGSYFEKFEEYRRTHAGNAITRFRVDFVNDVWKKEVVDIGVGCGHFMDSRDKTKGFDVSHYGRTLISARGAWCDPYEARPDAITCWDSLEHIKDCWSLIERVKKFVFLSIPVFNGPSGVMGSRHFKPNEHWWYPTEDGLVECFRQMGFMRIATAYNENAHGRQGIGTYAFERTERMAQRTMLD